MGWCRMGKEQYQDGHAPVEHVLPSNGGCWFWNGWLTPQSATTFCCPLQVFLPLVARLVNDPSAMCRQMVGACLSTLLRRAPPARRDRLAQFCGQWLGGADARLTRAAAQVRRGTLQARWHCMDALRCTRVLCTAAVP